MIVLAGLLLLSQAPAAAATPAPARQVVVETVDGADREAVAKAVGNGGGTVPWVTIVIHHSGQAEGSADAIDKHQREVVRSAVGIVDHFVIGNGTGSADGAVEVTGPWARGVLTPHLFRKGEWSPAISVTLVGDLESAPPTPKQSAALANVVAMLAARHRIGVERIVTHREVEGRGTTCPGKNLAKLDVLAAAGLAPKGPAKIRVESASGRVLLVQNDRIVHRFVRAAPRGATLPAGTWPVCRRDDGGAFGKTVVIAYPGPAEVAAAKQSGRISADEAKKLSRALAAGQCPPDDSALGGEIAFHGAEAADEGTACMALDPPDADILFKFAPPGTPVEIAP